MTTEPTPSLASAALAFKRCAFRNGWTTFNVRDQHADEAERRLLASSAGPAEPLAWQSPTPEQHLEALAAGDLMAIAEESGANRTAENVAEVTRCDLERIIAHAAIPITPSDEASEPAPCPHCGGSGEVMFMSDGGPDAYEVPGECPHCNGNQTLEAAYDGVVKLLASEENKYREATAILWWGRGGRTAADRIAEIAGYIKTPGFSADWAHDRLLALADMAKVAATLPVVVQQARQALRAFVATTPLPYGAHGTRDVDMAIWHAAHKAASAAFLPVQPFQDRVQPWLMECFGEMIAGDREERNHRFIEEALELVQACGCSASEAHQLVDYVFARPVGEKAQEVGGVMVTLAALCLAQDLDMAAAGETELARIWTKVEQIRAKQAAKPKYSPLPAAPEPDDTPLETGEGDAR